MIKKLILGCSLLLLVPAAASAQSATGECAIEKANIQKQIDYARQHGHTHKIAGLEKALSEVNQHCTDAGRRASNLQKVAEKEHKVAQRKAELEDAKMGGDAKKIAKKTKKLDEAVRELEEARSNVR
ncbi:MULTISPECIES: DUF1090 domain-containing protein [unclassified Bartonella]|uniref:DUF1090 domain-containing protein n=1 Tax=unclassified Bartonella TaxID=2645622 RepID=UPI0015F8648B|nr:MULTISPECIES: DUF1090 domain-containing protein [unclassified Bartonella]UXN02624.1 DUF1090 domain-containing protein [Bartonella sp. HY406]UXN05588.1 DUF1090 domain-containing protein [Bartonella sp. HY761]